MAREKNKTAVQEAPAAAPAKGAGRADAEDQRRPRTRNDGPKAAKEQRDFHDRKGPREHKDHRDQKDHRERSGPQQKGPEAKRESAPYARVTQNMSAPTWKVGSGSMSYLDMVRAGANKSVTEKPAEETPAAAKAPLKEPVKELAVEPAAVKEKPAPVAPAAPVAPVAPVAPPAVEVTKKEVPPPPTPPPPPKPEPTATYYVLEVDRVDDIKFPDFFLDNVSRDLTYTFSGTAGNPPPPPPPPAVPLQQAVPPPQQPAHTYHMPAHLYTPDQMPSRPGPGLNPNAFGMGLSYQEPAWERNNRFINPPGMQYSSHSPGAINRPYGLNTQPRPFGDLSRVRQNNGGSVW